jgi:hypothetical protein
VGLPVTVDTLVYQATQVLPATPAIAVSLVTAQCQATPVIPVEVVIQAHLDTVVTAV